MKGTLRRAVISFSRPAISWVRVGPSMTQGPAIRNRGLSLPTSCPPRCMPALGPCAGGAPRSGTRRLRQLRGPLGARGADEAGEQRVAVARRRGKLRMELRGDEPRVLRQLDHLDQVVAREAGETHARLAVAVQVVVVELIAVAVALHDGIAAVELA